MDIFIYSYFVVPINLTFYLLYKSVHSLRKLLLQDSLKNLLDLLESLRVDDLIIRRLSCIVDAQWNDILETLAKELNNHSLEDYDLQPSFQSVLGMIGMFAEKELQISKEEKGDSSS